MDPTVEAALVGAAATLIGVGGTVIVAVTSARNARLTNQATIDAAQADAKLTLEAAREAQYADRYSRALEQLGNDNQGIRIGGILALEGLALDSPRNHPTVLEVLIVYIREHSNGRAENDKSPRADVQAALTVIGRRNTKYDIRRVNLAATDLRGVNLRGASLNGAKLGDANLSHANLSGAKLAQANLEDADLRHADLAGADLRKARLRGIEIDEHTSFFGADLNGARWISGAKAPAPWTAVPDGSARGVKLKGPERWSSQKLEVLPPDSTQ